MTNHIVTWPCWNQPFSHTVRAHLYSRTLWVEQLCWLGWVGLPLSFWAVMAIGDNGHRTKEAAWIIAALVVVVIGTLYVGRQHVWGDAASFLRRGAEATSAWRALFKEAREKTEALTKLVSITDRSRDAQFRGAALAATATKLPYAYSLSASADVSFSPRQFAGGAVKAGTLRHTLVSQLVLELVRLGAAPIIFRDAEENIIAIWQLDEVVQFWSVLKVEPFGNELRVSERSGYQWWIPWTARSRTLDLSIARRFRNVTKAFGDGVDVLWPLFGVVTRPMAATFASLVAIFFPPLGLGLWASRLLIQARRRESFRRWNAPELGDSLDLALLQNERAMKPMNFIFWTVDSIVLPDETPAYPDILQRIAVRRELVGAAVTQALEEAINLSTVAVHSATPDRIAHGQ